MASNLEEKKNEIKNIKVPLFKSYILSIKDNTKMVYCLTLLNDGRLVSGSDDSSIIIYNKVTFKETYIIKLELII